MNNKCRYGVWLALAFLSGHFFRSSAFSQQQIPNRTLAEVVGLYGPTARDSLHRYLLNAGFETNPVKLTFLIFKQEHTLELWGQARHHEDWRLIKVYPIWFLSGNLGPKLQEGDLQVPEGIYRIVFLNPNSLFHLSLMLNYPNEFDRRMGADDGRNDLGKDIFIHGNYRSRGCIPIGDPAIEELFILAYDVGMLNITVIVSPVDFRINGFFPDIPSIPWEETLYNNIKNELQHYLLPVNIESQNP